MRSLGLGSDRQAGQGLGKAGHGVAAGETSTWDRSMDHQDTLAAGKTSAEKILASFTSCPFPEVARLGRS